MHLNILCQSTELEESMKVHEIRKQLESLQCEKDRLEKEVARWRAEMRAAQLEENENDFDWFEGMYRATRMRHKEAERQLRAVEGELELA